MRCDVFCHHRTFSVVMFVLIPEHVNRPSSVFRRPPSRPSYILGPSVHRPGGSLRNVLYIPTVLPPGRMTP
jgi:hypothetical protein